jgi:hypothetical protein
MLRVVGGQAAGPVTVVANRPNTLVLQDVQHNEVFYVVDVASIITVALPPDPEQVAAAAWGQAAHPPGPGQALPTDLVITAAVPPPPKLPPPALRPASSSGG